MLNCSKLSQPPPRSSSHSLMCSLIYLTDSRDRSIYKTTTESSRLLLSSFQWSRQPSIAFHACPFFHACFLVFHACFPSFHTENNHANKGKNKISQRKLFKLNSLLASDFSFPIQVPIRWFVEQQQHRLRLCSTCRVASKNLLLASVSIRNAYAVNFFV